MMGTDDALMDKVRSAADKTHERVWELPLWDDYDELIKSDVADVKNIGDGTAGTIVGGAFLKKFAEATLGCILTSPAPHGMSKAHPTFPVKAAPVTVCGSWCSSRAIGFHNPRLMRAVPVVPIITRCPGRPNLLLPMRGQP